MRILIVDDNISIGHALGRTLRQFGHDTLFTSDATNALDLLDGSIDAVISDIDMPGLNGVELARQIRERDETIPIAFCSGSDPNDETVQDAMSIGPVLPKPWTREEMLFILGELGRQSQYRAGRLRRIA